VFELAVRSCDVYRVQRASTGVPSTRPPAETTQRPWYSAPVSASGGGQSESSDSCVSVAESSAAVAEAPSEATTVVRRRLADETMLDLTTPTTAACRSLPDHDVVATPGTPRPTLSRRTSDVGSRPGSSRHAVLPPIRQLRSVDTVVTVGGDVGDLADS